jgi:hypothetical protein
LARYASFLNLTGIVQIALGGNPLRVL